MKMGQDRKWGYPQKELKVVTIGGGSGQYALLSGLRDLSGIAITAVVSMMDSGGSTGRLRDELGILPPGDILKCILALSPHQEAARTILLKRFLRDRRLKGHNSGNMLLTMLSRYTGSFPRGVAALSEILDTKGTILPVTVDKATLVAELTDGSRIYGERAIDIPRGDQREKIRDVFLVPHHDDRIHVFPPVLDAITEADVVILGPGDLFTSIIPNLIVPGVASALENTKAELFYVVNIMTKFGETHQFHAVDFVQQLEEIIHRPLDVIICNNKMPPEELRLKYADQKSECVEIHPTSPQWEARQVHVCDLLDIAGDVIRHDSDKLTVLLQSIFQESVS
jgi:uncharacterized cofD-like protein